MENIEINNSENNDGLILCVLCKKLFTPSCYIPYPETHTSEKKVTDSCDDCIKLLQKKDIERDEDVHNFSAKKLQKI
jgi:hypothetical protein